MQEVQNSNQEFLELIYTHPHWSSSIKPSLQKISNKILRSHDIIKKFQQFRFFSCTHRKPKTQGLKQFKYNQLLKQYQKQLPDIASNLAKIILQHQEKPPKFPILYSGVQKQIQFTKKQKVLLTSMMAMNLIPDQSFNYKYRFPFYTNFSYIFSQENYKTKGIIEYLKMQFKKMNARSQKNSMDQKLTLRRKVINENLSQIIQRYKNMPMISPILAHDKQSIQEYFGDIKVDFANKFIGGGALESGCVQQQIMFANHPQMYSSVLFCEMMRQNESIQFIGYKKYFNNLGYGFNLEYGGLQEHKYQYDQQNRAMQKIVGIDALHYPSKKHQSQFKIENINRQIIKAYAGFKSQGNQRIVSGNWGCGVFNGDLQLKFIIQWIASSLAKKQLVYVPFGQRNKLFNQPLLHRIQSLSVGKLYQLLISHQQQLKKQRNIYKLLQQKIGLLPQL